MFRRSLYQLRQNHHHLPFAFCGVSFSDASPDDANAEWTREIMKQIALSTFFEIEH
jgi:hypothetical protein